MRSRSLGPKGPRSGMVRLFVNVGGMDNARPGDIAGMIYNTAQIPSGSLGTIEVFEAELIKGPDEKISLVGTFLNPPVVFSILGVGFSCAWMFGNDFLSIAGLIGLIGSVVLAVAHFESRGKSWSAWYDRLLVNTAPFTILVVIAVAAGGLVQIIPTVVAHNAANVEDRRQLPYTPLELAGRDIFVSEGCYNCHSQMIRTLVPDVLRYGDYSRLGESIYDHPFQWGSKRTGPDLARVAGAHPRSRIRRALSLCQSLAAVASRLSWFFLPLARDSSSLAMPFSFQ